DRSRGDAALRALRGRHQALPKPAELRLEGWQGRAARSARKTRFRVRVSRRVAREGRGALSHERRGALRGLHLHRAAGSEASQGRRLIEPASSPVSSKTMLTAILIAASTLILVVGIIVPPYFRARSERRKIE